jgi:hypothetical protein
MVSKRVYAPSSEQAAISTNTKLHFSHSIGKNAPS